MTNAFDTFDSRLKKIDRNRTRLAQGYSAKVTNDGLIVFRPKRIKRSVPLQGLLFLIGGFFLFKAMILAGLGTDTYEQRVTALSSGTVIEQAGAYVMQKDPVTAAVAEKLRPLLY
ncbi:hypothetical protein [Roseovarius aestuariivivens]|uniref:hypothetical protein n=1 Tax=Roseovarius aestuariivivens TaxID=1888910 RepID=UPI00108174BD|nr:hypothetical protein [Roseovarius aestuariivivens]